MRNPKFLIILIHLSILVTIVAFTNTDESVCIHIKGRELYIIKPTRAEWFYNLNYSKLSYNITRISPLRYEKTRLITNHYFPQSFVHPNYFLKSTVYIAEFDDAYLSPQPVFGNSRIIVFEEELPASLTPRKTVGFYDVGVYYTQIIGQWGHLIHDFFCAMMHVPEEVYNKGFYICPNPSGYKMISDYLKYFKMDKNIHVLDIDTQTEQVFVKKLYVLSTLHFAHGYTVGGIHKLRKLISNNFNLAGIQPYKYSIINRDRSRKIHNIRELLAALSKECPPKTGKWQIEYWNFRDFGQTVKIWSTIKVVCHPNGSGFYYSLFMQKNTGYLSMMSKQIDYPNFHLAAISEIFMVGVVHSNMEHYFTNPIPCNISKMVAGCKVLFELMEKGICSNPKFEISINIEQAKNTPDFEKNELYNKLKKEDCTIVSI